ncbi:glycosyltransferase family 4 protein [Leptospira interrogans]|uniref:Glycosyltransferase family 4 protein n=1 Tax=Leptospira interrogans serovar Bataviae TaxID=312175 RepID=A0AAQ0B2B4_LEPIR|nr:glycosyltransferase family 1 protein [Leptospira interrogans]QOI50333.1 glycosyltransferase family 4 protein [Leptospira interrogans serovar Bataviae]
MILGIDASNIKSGGTVTHLKELLENAKPEKYGFTKVILWSVESTLLQINDRPWLVKASYPELSGNRFLRWYWQKFKLSILVRENGCDLLFIPGGAFSGKFRPFIAMSQNLLPFEWREWKRYGFSFQTLRLILLYVFQGITFRRSQEILFLTEYAKNTIFKKLNILNKRFVVIPHGINRKFFHKPRKQIDFLRKGNRKPIRLLYVSFIGAYKHQWNVVEAVGKLNRKGFTVHLDLVGAKAEKRAVNRLFSKMKDLDPDNRIVSLYTKVSYETIQKFYKNADIFLFASTCENLPNILIEAMAGGLPILSSNFGPMPEILGNAGLYFDPLNVDDIADQLEKLIKSKKLRESLSAKAFEKAKQYSWKKNADLTFRFFQDVLKRFSKFERQSNQI